MSYQPLILKNSWRGTFRRRVVASEWNVEGGLLMRLVSLAFELSFDGRWIDGWTSFRVIVGMRVSLTLSVLLYVLTDNVWQYCGICYKRSSTKCGQLPFESKSHGPAGLCSRGEIKPRLATDRQYPLTIFCTGP